MSKLKNLIIRTYKTLRWYIYVTSTGKKTELDKILQLFNNLLI